MKLNDIVEVYPYGYDQQVRREMGRIAVVTQLDVYNHSDIEIKYTDGNREYGMCIRDLSVDDAYCINGNRRVWYAIKVIDGQGS